MRTFPGAIGVMSLLVLAGTACAGEMCKWVDEDGCVHYAASCPPGVESEKLALPAPPTDAQRTAAAEGYESAREYLDDRDDQRSKDGDGDRFRSISTAALGPLPENLESRYLTTTSTHFGIHIDDMSYSLMLTVKAKPNLPIGSLLQAHIPDPSNRHAHVIIERTVERKGQTLVFHAGSLKAMYCQNFPVIVRVYEDFSAQRLLGTHRQTIQARVDSRLVKSRSDLVAAVTNGLCPDRMTEKSVEELKQICEEARERLLKPLRKEKIEQCASEKRKTREECERFYSTFGDATMYKRYYLPRMFDNIPECVAARKVDDRDRE